MNSGNRTEGQTVAVGAGGKGSDPTSLVGSCPLQTGLAVVGGRPIEAKADMGETPTG